MFLNLTTNITILILNFRQVQISILFNSDSKSLGT